MDITTQRAAPTAALHLRGLNGERLYSPGEDGKPDMSKPVRIHFYSPGSKQQAAAEARATQRALVRLQENDNRPNPPSPEVRREEAADDLASVTHSFENLDYPPAGGAQGEALFRALFADPDLGWIATQSAVFIGNWGNFKPSSATS